MRSHYFLSSLILVLTVVGSGCTHPPDRLPGLLDIDPIYKPLAKSVPAAMTTGTPIDMQDYCKDVPKIPVGIEELNKKIKEHPEDATLYLKRGRIYFQSMISKTVSSNSKGSCYATEHGDLARTDFDRAIQLEPKNASAYFERSKPFMVGGVTSSIQYLNRAIELDSHHSEYYWSRAVSYSTMGKYDLALKDITVGLTLTTDTVERENFTFLQNKIETELRKNTP